MSVPQSELPLTNTPTWSRGWRAALLLVMAVAAALRLAGIEWGLPTAAHPAWSFHPDEAFHLDWARRLAAGQLIAQHFQYGGTLHYTLLNACYRYATVLADHLGGVNPLANAILFARYCACVFSLVTVALVAHIGARLFDVRTGVTAALLLALAPAHVFLAQNLRPDELSGLLATLLLWLGALIYGGTPATDRRLFIAAGLLLGLAVALRFPLIAFGIAPVAGWVCREARGSLPLARLWPLGLVLVLAMLVGYALGSPHSLLYWRVMLDGLRLQAGYQQGPFLDTLDESGTVWHTLWLLPREALGTPTYLLALLGAGLGLRYRRCAPGLLTASVLPYLLGTTLVSWTVVRYSLPATPLLALLAAAALHELWQRGRVMRALAAVLLTGSVLWTGAADIAFAKVQAGPNVRDKVADWLAARATPASSYVAFRLYALQEFYATTAPAGHYSAWLDVSGPSDPLVIETKKNPVITDLIVPEPVYRGLDRWGQRHPHPSARKLHQLLRPDGHYRLVREFKVPATLFGIDFTDHFRSQDFFVINPGFRLYTRVSEASPGAP